MMVWDCVRVLIVMLGAGKAWCCVPRDRRVFGMVTLTGDSAICGCDVCPRQWTRDHIHLVPLLIPNTLKGTWHILGVIMCLRAKE